jgi:enoyl-CoA hydratase/carnithine racemase
MEEYRTLIYEPGPVTRIIHNEPEKNNVMGGDFEKEFLDAMDRFDKDREAKVAVTLARGKHFAAGHDMGNLAKKQSWKAGEAAEWGEAKWRRACDPRSFVYPLWDVAKPLVVGVQGAALAAGAHFALLHDIVVMGENAYLGFEIGRVSGAGGGAFLQMWFGYRKAFEILCSGWNVSAQELHRLGAINKVVPDDRIEAEAMRYGEIISLMPAETLKLNKSSLKFGMNRMGMREMLWHGEETNILAHCAGDEREKEFYRIIKEKGLKAALEFRDGPFEKYGYDRHTARDI